MISNIEYPKHLTVMVTSRCNLRCKLCYQTEYHSDLDPRNLDAMRHIYPELEWFHPIGGEPFLYDLKKLYSLPFSDRCKIKLITNGTMISPENTEDIVRNVARLIVSIDGGTNDAYRAMRGYSLDKVLQGIERIQSCKAEKGRKTPRIELNFLMTKTTVNTLPQLALYAAKQGIQCINIFYPSFRDPDLMDAEKIQKVEAVGSIEEARKYVGIIEPEKRGGDKCMRPWNTCFVDVKANVFLCCFGSPAIGNLNKMTFDDCWHGPEATNIRKTVNTKKEMRCCKNCMVR